jgi:AcrR family transcriptional regulator
LVQRSRAGSCGGEAARPGQGSSEQERREAREQRLLDAAAGLILRYGYHKTTIDDITRETRVSRGTFYLHFQTRERC